MGRLKVKLVDPNSAIKVGGARRTGAASFTLEDNEGTRRLIRNNILENLGEVKPKQQPESSKDDAPAEAKEEKSSSKNKGSGKAGGTEKLKM